MIIDCHGHYTTAPPALEPGATSRSPASRTRPPRPTRRPEISDDDLRETIEANQLKLMNERGSDLTIFCPRASFMAHHIGDFSVSSTWAAICNDLCSRVSKLYPDRFRSGGDAAAVARASTRRRALPELDGASRSYGAVGDEPQPRPVRRPLDRAAADRPLLVPDLREDGRVRHPRDGARQHVAATRPSTPPARTTSTPTPRPSCSCSRATCSPTSRRCASSSRTAAARCPTTGAVSAASRMALKKPLLEEHLLATSSSTPASTTSPASTC